LAGLGQALLHRELAFSGIDRWVTTLYRAGGWLLFRASARIAYFALVSVGLALFAASLVSGAHSLVTVEGSYLLGGVVLGVLQLVVILVHEHAHALTTKHFGREVTRGGFMLYLGLPAFFVDTSDIWMAPKRARLAVSWAGPYSELVLGGLTSIGAWLLGPTVAGNVLFKFALLLYLGAFLNLNPLLELDGYYLLMDWLEVPMLRRRSFTFIRDRLVDKLRRQESFTPEDRLFTWFGLFSLAYTVLAVTLALYLYYRYALGAAVLLWQTKSWFGRGLIVAFYAAVVLPLLYFVLLALLRGLRDGLRWARESDFFQDPYRLGALAVLGALVLWYVPQKFFPAWDLTLYGGLLALGSVVVAAGALLLARWYDDPVPRVGAVLFALWAGGLLAAELLGLAGRPWLARVDMVVAWGAFLASAVLAWRVTSAFRLRLRDVLLVAVVAGGSALVAGALAQAAGGRISPSWLFLAPACASLGLGWMTAAARAYGGTPLALGVAFAWCGLTLGVLATWLWAVGEVGLGGGAFAAEPAVFAVALLVGGLALVRIAYGRLGRWRAEPTRAAALSDAQRLADAFQVLLSSVLARFQALSGIWVLAALRARLTEHAEFPKEVSLEGVRVQVAVRPAEGILSLASQLRSALALVFGEVRRYVRDTYLAQLVERVFSELSWDEREAVSEYLLRGEDWQRALIQAHQARREGLASFLTQSPVFADLTADEVQAVVARLRRQQFHAGEVIVRQGDPGDTFYLIARGRVGVTVDGPEGPQEMGELVEGDYFGEIALLRETTRTATCRALDRVEALTLSREDFGGLLAHHFAVAGKVEKVAALSAMLRRMPLFADFSPKQLQALLARLRGEAVPAGSVVVRQGEPGDRFYIIASGLVEVVVREEAGGERVVAHLGRGEYFGEIALLTDVPRTATVRTVTECEFFGVSRREFDELVRVHVLAGRHLEQVSSRRLLDTRRKLVGGTEAAGGR
jgi:putative peptide zinc metalloprotease protein